jgi:hypothetical protein
MACSGWKWIDNASSDFKIVGDEHNKVLEKTHLIVLKMR